MGRHLISDNIRCEKINKLYKRGFLFWVLENILVCFFGIIFGVSSWCVNTCIYVFVRHPGEHVDA